MDTTNQQVKTVTIMHICQEASLCNQLCAVSSRRLLEDLVSLKAL